VKPRNILRSISGLGLTRLIAVLQVGIIGVTGVRVNQGISGSGNCFRESELAFGHTTRGVLATGKVYQNV